jgi:hypothetical protein
MHLMRRSALASALTLALATASCGGADESLGEVDSGGGGQGGTAGAAAGSGGSLAGKGGAGSAGKAGGTSAGGASGQAGSAGLSGQGGAAGKAGASGQGNAGGTSGKGGSSGGMAGAGGSGQGGAAGGDTGGAGSGNAGSGNAGSGNAGSGNAGSGNAGSGQAGGGDAGSAQAGAGQAGGGSAGSGGALGDFCASQGSTIPIPGAKCTGDLGKKTFLFALCSCSSVKANNTITTDSLDSMTGQSTGKNGSMGVRGDYDGQQAAIGGSFWVDGSISMGNKHSVAVALQCGGPLDSHATEVSIAEDAYVEGDMLEAQGKVTVGQTLHIPAGKQHAGVVAASVVEGPVDVASPCDCDAPIDIVGLVASFSQSNDDAANGVTPSGLAGLSAPVTQELPCGRYYFSSIESNSSVTIKLTGHTAIFIGGDVHVSGPLSFELGPDAELDLFLAGSFNPHTSVAIGSTARPAATRVYIAGDVVLSGQLDLAANLYMPNTIFEGKNTVEMWGALYAKGLSLDGAFTVHYDEAILDVPGCAGGAGGAGGAGQAGSGQSGSGQSGSPPACTSCKGCDNPTPACHGGTCGPCATNGDCCPPLICNSGTGQCVVPGGKP